MGNLKNYDQFTAGNKQQYKQIAKRSKIENVDSFAEDCVIRGGCFFSQRKNTLIPGLLENGNEVEFKEFINKL